MIIKLIYTFCKLNIERWQEKNIIHSSATQRLSQSNFCFVSLETFSYIYETFSKSLKSISYSAKSPCNYIDELQTSANTHFPNHQCEEWSGIWSIAFPVWPKHWANVFPLFYCQHLNIAVKSLSTQNSAWHLTIFLGNTAKLVNG